MLCLGKVAEQWILETNGRVQENLLLTEKGTEGRRTCTRKVSVGKTQLLFMVLLLNFNYASCWKDKDKKE